MRVCGAPSPVNDLGPRARHCVHRRQWGQRVGSPELLLLIYLSFMSAVMLTMRCAVVCVIVTAAHGVAGGSRGTPLADPRYAATGWPIQVGGYACQPYCVVLSPGEWVCVMTANTHDPHEGAPGEHMVAMRTSDSGRSWSPFVTLEPYTNTSTAQVSAYGSIAAREDGSRIFACVSVFSRLSSILNTSAEATD